MGSNASSAESGKVAGAVEVFLLFPYYCNINPAMQVNVGIPEPYQKELSKLQDSILVQMRAKQCGHQRKLPMHKYLLT